MFAAYTFPLTPSPPPFAMTTAPVVVDVDAVVLLIATVEEDDRGPERLNPVSVPTDVIPGCAALTDRTLPTRDNPLLMESAGSNVAAAVAAVMNPCELTNA